VEDGAAINAHRAAVTISERPGLACCEQETEPVHGTALGHSHEVHGLLLDSMLGRRLVMVLEVEWTELDGRHEGALTDELAEFAGQPILIGTGGGKYTARDLFGRRVKILSTKTEEAQDLVKRSRAAGYLIGW
jgi:hypothetical protein